MGGQNEGFPLTKPMAVNIGLRNCAACDLNILQGSVAMPLRCDGMFNNSLIANLLMNQSVEF